jgi:hypothetical protein
VALGRDLYRYTFRRLHGDSPELAYAAAGPARTRQRATGSVAPEAAGPGADAAPNAADTPPDPA